MSGLHWLKSSFSDAGGNNCVEVAAAEGTDIAIRESARPERIVTTNRAALRALVLGVKADGVGLS
ncbi:DUF397 domain-containing protein [Streptomyces sp. Ncost-T10-10d]|uniref:DUF397 domain-containing protein n=1 Tax=Streptomyces sp. Ncost-T10-10d TaxID=1839774 RepID=UPI00081EECA0|nr:DUF397 domain-containing protein [Streptomyces sp. Ncost-T10-10d]SCF57786.1 protein of unknown function [Streptomyces sp. Ncost-T10-10d]